MKRSIDGSAAGLLAAEIARDPGSARASDIVELARLALGDLSLYERRGADGVGTDDHAALVGAAPALAGLVETGSPDVRLAAAYGLAFVLEHANASRALLERLAVEEPDLRVKAGFLVAAARLRSTLAEIRAGADGRPRKRGAPTLDASAPAVLRAVEAIEWLFDLPDFPRFITPAWVAALDAVDGDTDVGPWGGGRIGALIAACRENVRVEEDRMAGRPPPAPAVAEDEDDDEDEDDAEDGEDDDDEENFGNDDVEDPYTQQRPVRAAPRVELHGMREIAWRELEHAYGDARGVPGMIDGLSSPDPADRAWALDALDASIHHQGSVYSASTAATPFLVALLDHAEVEVRPEVLVLLCGLAVYAPDEFVVDGARGDRSEAYEAVRAGGPTYVRLLGDPDARVRTAAAFVLGYCDPPPSGARDALRAALAVETDPRARASELLAIGYVARYENDGAAAEVLAEWLDDASRFVRGAAALATLQLLRQEAPPRARAIAAESRSAPPVRGFFPWSSGDLGEIARAFDAAFKGEAELWAALDRARVEGADEDAKEAARRASPRLFNRLFRDEVHDGANPWLPSELDAPRRRFLDFHVDTTPPSKDGLLTSMVFWEAANDVGLFAHREALVRVLGRSAGPLDEEIEIDGARRPIWAFWRAAHADAGTGTGEQRGLEPAKLRSALVAQLGARPAAERRAILDEILDAPYRLTSSPWHIDWGSPDAHPRSSRASNDYTSSTLTTMAAIAGADAEIVAWAEASGRPLLENLARRDTRRGVLVALVLARAARARGAELPAAYDALLGFDRAPASTYRRALREVFALLPSERALRLVLGEPLYRYHRYIDPRGEVRRWENGAGWDVLDMAPAEVIAREVIAARREWERHLAAGDDRHAEPVGGSRTTSQRDKPGPDQPFPEARALELLGVAGEAAIAALDALPPGAIDAEFLERARASADGQPVPPAKRSAPKTKPAAPKKKVAPPKKRRFVAPKKTPAPKKAPAPKKTPTPKKKPAPPKKTTAPKKKAAPKRPAPKKKRV